jgi:hypothetical protein
MVIKIFTPEIKKESEIFDGTVEQSVEALTDRIKHIIEGL